MGVEVRRITDYCRFEELYHFHMKKDFPESELRPLSNIQRLWEQNKYECYGLYEGEMLLGYAGFYKNGNNFLFDYFAIVKEQRNKGLGSRFLQDLKGCITGACCVLVEIEDADKTRDQDKRCIRKRRQAFYGRNGYRITEVTARVFGEDYRILELPTGPSHSKAVIEELYSSFYQDILPPHIFRTSFQITS